MYVLQAPRMPVGQKREKEIEELRGRRAVNYDLLHDEIKQLKRLVEEFES